MAEKHTVYFTMEKNSKTNVLLKQMFTALKEYQPSIFRRPLPPFNSKQKYTDVNELPVNHPEATIYSVDYNTGNSGFSFNFNNDLIIVNQVFDIGMLEEDEKVIQIARSCYTNSIAVVSGFEIDLFIDDYENSLHELLADVSLYPIFAKAKGLTGYQYEWEDFKIYSFLDASFGERERLLANYLSKIKAT